MDDKHEKNELAIFRLFAPMCGLPIRLDSIEKRPPGEPDILCNLADGSPRAFEMVEVVDRERIAKIDGDAKELIEHLENGHRNLPGETKAEFDRRFGDAWVRIKVRPSVSLRRRKKIMDRLLDQMMKLDPGFEGTFPVIEKGIEFASVQVKRRKGTRGPRFVMPTTSCYRPVPLDVVEEKFNKTYLADAPVELLAYYDKQSAPPEEQLRELSGFVESRLRGSCFRRVWVFNTSDRRICFSVGEDLRTSAAPDPGSSSAAAVNSSRTPPL